MDKSYDAVIIGAGIIPVAIEFMDKPAIEVCEAFAKAGYPMDVEALLIIEVEGSEEEIVSRLKQIEEIVDPLSPVAKMPLTISRSLPIDPSAAWVTKTSSSPGFTFILRARPWSRCPIRRRARRFDRQLGRPKG